MEETTIQLGTAKAEVPAPRIMEIVGPDGRKAPVLLVPTGVGNGYEVHDGIGFIDECEPRTAPHRTTGTSVVEALESFIAHVNRFKRAETALFVRRSPPMLEAVYDYHTAAAPAFMKHRATFAFAPTMQWSAWQSVNGRELGQVSFAEFLETHSSELVAPDGLPPSAREAITEAEQAVGMPCVHPDAIRALARGLEYHRQASSSELRNLRTGECKVSFEEKLTAKDGEVLDIPGLFAIAVEMFNARFPEVDPEDPTKRLPPKVSRYVIPVRLRVRASQKEGEGLKWTMILHNVDRCIDLALTEAADRVARETERPMFWGSPEKA